MLAKRSDGQVVEVTEKAYSVLYKQRGWVLVGDEDDKDSSTSDDQLQDLDIEEDIDLSTLKKSGLQDLADKKGIEYKSSATKDELIDLLK